MVNMSKLELYQGWRQGTTNIKYYTYIHLYTQYSGSSDLTVVNVWMGAGDEFSVLD